MLVSLRLTDKHKRILVNKNIMETVQTSVNIITRWKKSVENEEGKGKQPIQLCDVSVVCITYIHFSNIRKLRQDSENTLKKFSKPAFVVTERKKALRWENIRRGRGFHVFLSFHMLPHLRHMFFVVFARNITFEFALLAARLSLSTVPCFRSIKYM